MQFQFEPEATEELEEAAAYLDEQSSRLGERFLAEVESARQLMERFPRSGSPLRGALRRTMLRTFPYQLIDRVEGDLIRIYAVAHLKRRSGYWRKRLQR